MKSSEKQKLSLTPSILGTFGFETLKYLLPSALSTAAEYETTGNLTSGAWRLCWRSSTSDASTKPGTGQKSDWNALPPSWSSHCVCHVLLISVTYTCNCLSRILFTYRQHWTARLNQYTSSHSSSVASLTFPQIHTYSDRNLLDSRAYRSATGAAPHTRTVHPPTNPHLVEVSVARKSLAPRESLDSSDKSRLAFNIFQSEKKKRLTARLNTNINCTVITLLHLFLLITCVGANHNLHPDKIPHHDQLLSNLYHLPQPDSNPSIVDIPGLDQVLVKEDLKVSKPSRAELIERTPGYMFDMHDRHKRDWWDFDQFSDGHLKHPLQLQNTREYANRKLGTVTAIRHHKHI
ncbi:hypothetical protein CSKR_100520, partial [Clonorchis sinensis]